MRKLRHVSVGVAVAVLFCLASGPLLAGKKKPQMHKAQTTKTFVNEEAVAAVGLTVALSTAAEVKTNAETGRAGPFRDVSGNGTKTITLTNAEAAVEPGSDSFELVFNTYEKKIAVKSWWWIDEKGKRIGEKKKG